MDPFTGRRLSEITEADLVNLIEREVPESIGLDYKAELTIDQKDANRANTAKQRFLQDLTAMANTNGGLMLYGIEERRDDNKKTGLPDKVVGIDIASTDEFTRKIEHLLRDGVDEPLPGNVEIELVDVAESKRVVAIRVPKSYRAPHRVIVAKANDFYRRTNGGKEPMTTAQIRDAVLGSETQYEQGRSWSEDRWLNSGMPAKKEGWTLHYVPILRQPNLIDFYSQTVVDAVNRIPVPCLDSQSHTDRRWCFEGMLVRWSNMPEECVVIFRDGAIEFLGKYSIRVSHDGLLEHVRLERDLIKACEGVLMLLNAGGSLAPGLLSLRLFVPGDSAIVTGADRSWYASDKRDGLGVDHDFERSFLGSIESIVQGTEERADQIAQPLLDRIWNAANHPRCLGYNDEGEYVGYQ
ncbi:MAG: ATP-binding protein [Planctomycetota bacterium]